MAMQWNEQVQELGLRIEALEEVARAIGEDDNQPLGRALLHLVARVQEGYQGIEMAATWPNTAASLPQPLLQT